MRRRTSTGATVTRGEKGVHSLALSFDDGRWAEKRIGPTPRGAMLSAACPEGWIPEQKITAAEAIREKLKGSIEPGKLADLVVLSRDIDGKVIYRRGK
ncbi:MAG TPA: hypothetical protein VN442_24915 [Bryobacteraceae bacterium]|nr:hypothetical protein [Bryobacteraceae bacterium]